MKTTSQDQTFGSARGPAPAPRRLRPEAQLQRVVVGYLSVLEAQGRLAFFAIPNGGRRGLIEAANFKREGVRAGVPDICILFPSDHTVFLELKAPKGRLSPAQSEFIDRVMKLGARCYVVDSFEEAQGTIDALVKAYPLAPGRVSV